MLPIALFLWTSPWDSVAYRAPSHRILSRLQKPGRSQKKPYISIHQPINQEQIHSNASDTSNQKASHLNSPTTSTGLPKKQRHKNRISRSAKSPAHCLPTSEKTHLGRPPRPHRHPSKSTLLPIPPRRIPSILTTIVGNRDWRRAHDGI